MDADIHIRYKLLGKSPVADCCPPCVVPRAWPWDKAIQSNIEDQVVTTVVVVRNPSTPNMMVVIFGEENRSGGLSSVYVALNNEQENYESLGVSGRGSLTTTE